MSDQVPCRSCGEMNYAADSQCMECGADLSQSAKTRAPVGSPAPTSRRATPVAAAPRKSSAGRWVALGVLGVIVVAAGAGYLWYKDRREKVNELCMAAANGNTATVQQLLDDGVPVDACEKRTGWTALHWAASTGETECAALLLERGADVNAPDSDGLTPLDLATLMQLLAIQEAATEVDGPFGGTGMTYSPEALELAGTWDPVIELLKQQGGTLTLSDKADQS